MNDMLGTPITIGDVVLYPGGNARYGGLKLMVGVVKRLTPKRVSLVTGSLTPDGKVHTFTNKTGAKILVCKDPAVLNSPQVQAIRIRLLPRTERENTN